MDEAEKERTIEPGRVSCSHLISILIHPTSFQVINFQLPNRQWVVPLHMLLPGIPFPPFYLVNSVNPSCISCLFTIGVEDATWADLTLKAPVYDLFPK